MGEEDYDAQLAQMEAIRQHAADFYKDYEAGVERELMKGYFDYVYSHIEARYIPAFMKVVDKRKGLFASNKGIDNFSKLVDDMFENSVFVSKASFERFLRNRRLFVGAHVLERAHVVDAVGEFDQDAAKIAVHRQKHLAEVCSLAVFARLKGVFVEFRQGIDERRDFFVELTNDIGIRRIRVFDNIVKKRSTDTRFIEFDLCDELRNAERVDDVRLPRLAAL